MDGSINNKHDPMPGLTEFQKTIQPVWFAFQAGKLLIENYYGFVDLTHLAATFEREEFGDE